MPFCTCKSQKTTCINQFSTSIMSQDNMYESVLSSIMYVLRNRTQIISHGSKHLFQLSHLIPTFIFIYAFIALILFIFLIRAGEGFQGSLQARQLLNYRGIPLAFSVAINLFKNLHMRVVWALVQLQSEDYLLKSALLLSCGPQGLNSGCRSLVCYLYYCYCCIAI